MPTTTAEHNRSLVTPGIFSLLPIRDFLPGALTPADGVMVRTDGCYVAGFQLGGSLTYFGDDAAMNEMKSRIEALLRTIPEESMRVQFRYEVVENANGLIDRYEALQRTESDVARRMDAIRMEGWRKEEEHGEFLTRLAAVYFIWDPALHESLNRTTTSVLAGHKDEPKAQAAKAAEQPTEPEPGGGFPGAIRRLFKKTAAPVSTEAQAQIGKKKHLSIVTQFESFLRGIESSLKTAGLDPSRMAAEEFFAEVSRALSPNSVTRRGFRSPNLLGTRSLTAREQLGSVSILNEAEDYLNIDGFLYGCITMKVPPEATFPGIIRELLTCGFPLTISVHIVIPNQQKVIEKYKSRYKKMQAAQMDKDGNHKVDVGAAVQARELLEIQERLISGSCKTTQVSFSITYRTSKPATTSKEYEQAERQLASCRQQLLQVVARRNGANALAETLAKRRIFFGTLPGLATSDRRDMDLLSEHAADLVPLEMPWSGMQREPLTLWHTPYRHLLPYSPFDASLENANALICANSGSGKSVLIGKLLLTCARRDTKVSILERGDSYKTAVELMGGQMLKMSLDSRFTINPFDLEPGQTTPSKDHVAFLKTLARYMIGGGGNYDADILDGILDQAIKTTYDRIASKRSGSKTPVFSDLKADLETFQERGQPKIEELAHIAAFKLGSWVGQGMYANLFDRQTTVPMTAPWLYFNIEQLKDDPRLETAMSLLIAYATTNRAAGEAGRRSIVILDECWSLLDSRDLSVTVEQLFRTARKRNACVWGVSQSVEDFTGTPDNPKPIGAAILSTTATRLIGRQKGNIKVLEHFLHFNPIVCNAVKSIGMTEKGKQSQFLLAVGDNPETTQIVFVRITPFEYWTMTTMPREKTYRDYWQRLHPDLSMFHQLYLLSQRYPNGISALPELPEEVSGEVYQSDPAEFTSSQTQEAHA